MEHYFDLPVTYNNQEFILKGRLATFAYTYKFFIIVDGQELIFERDDEYNYRTISTSALQEKNIDNGLIEKIIDALNRIQL